MTSVVPVVPGPRVAPLGAAEVHDTLRRHLLVDGFDLVLDLERSRGSRLVDARTGTSYLDLFTFFASNALGMNHPALADDPVLLAELGRTAVNKPSNSDVYTVAMARFVEAFARVLGDPALPHLFFVDGGALAVENALKVAFDWKSRTNERAGRSAALGTRVLHLEHAFHGRSGYTLSLTNTDPVKTDRYPTFAWPRISSPYVSSTRGDVEAREAEALAEAEAAFAAFPHDIACFVMEPIQGEGGDHHFRPEFLQAMQRLCHRNDALFVLDEVQTGCGLTGTAWAYQQLGVTPDVVAFGKKTQVCGVLAGGRVDEIPDHVFAVSSRVNSTWGGNLTDMVRARRIFEVIEEQGLIAAARLGSILLDQLRQLQAELPELVDNPRGRGLMCAFSLPSGALRDQVVTRLRDEEQVLLLGCGRRSLRFRPALTVAEAELAEGVAAVARVLTRLTATRSSPSSTAGAPPAPVEGAGGTLDNPARTSEVVAEVSLASADQLVDAFRAAAAAQPAWADTPAPVRGRVIARVGRLVEANAEALAQLVTREVGKPLAEARGEVQEIVDTCDFFLGEGRRLYGQTVPSEMRDKQLFTFRVPVGVAGIITAGNFPVAVPSWYLVPALLCGNAVVWKPAEYSAALAGALTQLFVAGGVPAGVLNTVPADGANTFDALASALEQGLVQKVGFTGSSEVGARIGELCGRHLQSPCLELGGKNPLVVMPDADLDLAVEGALFSGFGTAGQRCTSLGVAVVHEQLHDEFVRRLVERLRAAPIGDPTADVLYGPMLSERFLAGFEKWLGELGPHHQVHGSDGVGRISSANPRTGFVGDPDEGVYAHPTIVTGVRPDDVIYRNETFGPLVPVMPFGSFDEAVELANGHGYGLSAAIYTRSPEHAFGFRQRVSAGMLSVNNSTSGAEAHLPFGGNGRSGNGSRQSGMWVLDQFTRWQAMNWDYAGKLQRAQMDVEEAAGDPNFQL